MTMSLIFLFAIVCAGTAVSQEQVPCYGEGCANVTVYLGPRWGSKVIMVPRKTIMVSPRANSTSGLLKLDGDVKITGDRFEEYDERYRRPQHRPVPQNGEMQVDFMDDEPMWMRPFPTTESPYQSNIRWPWWSRTTTRRPPEQPWWSRTTTRRPPEQPWWSRTTTRRPPEQPWWSRTTTRRSPEQPWWRPRPTTTKGPQELRSIPTNYPGHDIRVVFDGNWRGTVDLSWRGYTGEDVKKALMTLPESDRRQVTKLILDGNKIQYLPSMMFPIEFEYGLLELSLNDNPINPPYLSSYTRFELSRLGHLKTLNMSRCGLRSIDMPYLPSIEVLDLSYNEITYLPQTLGRLTGLFQLFLRGNKLSYISQTPLSSLKSLWVLDLGDNGLSEFWGEPLENLGNLVTVRLDNNFLTSMPLLDVTRTKIVFLANNSLRCSCSLLHWLQRPNMQIQDVHDESCQDGYNAILLKRMMIWSADYYGLCGRDQWWGIRAWNAFTLWYHRNPDIMRNIYRVVGVTIVVMVLVVLLRKRRRLMAKVKPQGIPYNFLDDQHISIVSGPQSHA